MNRKMSIKNLAMRFSDGGAQPPAPPAPAPAPPAPVATPPAPAPGITPSQAATVDMDSLISQAATKAAELAERKNESVFRSMLQQSGLDVETVNKISAEWKAKQQTPEQIAAAKDGTITNLTSDNQKLQRQLAAVGKGIPAEKSDKYIALAQSYLGEDGDFGKALDAALADFPIPAAQNPAQPAAQNPAPAQQLPMGMNLFQPEGSGAAGGSEQFNFNFTPIKPIPKKE